MAREWTKAQLDALTEDNNLLVAASAGSGKTAVLIEKIFRLLKEGSTLKRMAVMTFTDLAATELKDRLTDKLLEEIRKDGGSDHLKAELEYIPFADVSTIHSFCKRLYKRYYAEIGEDFCDDTLSGDEAETTYKECATQAVAEMRSRNIPAFDRTFWHFYGRDRGGARLVNAIVELHKFLECVEDKEDFFDNAIREATLPFDRKTIEKDYLEYYRKRLAKLRVQLENNVRFASVDSGYSYVEKYLATLAVNIISLVDATSLKDLVQKTHSAVEAMKTSSGRKMPFSGSKLADERLKTQFLRIIASYQAIVDDIANTLTGYEERLTQDVEAGKHVEQLLVVTRLAEDLYEERKKKEGKIDFSDLERLAVKVIEDPVRLDEICQGYDYVFVDEYQDTNYLQERIVSSVSTCAKAFFIGDGKQSIYRFRYAEPQIFFDRREAYARRNLDGKNKTFSHNFRSDKRILDFVNSVFRDVMSRDFGGVFYEDEAFVAGSIEFPDLSAIDTTHPAPPVVEVSVFPNTERNHSTPTGEGYDIKADDDYEEDKEDLEAEYIASRIKNSLGAPIVSDPIRDSFVEGKKAEEYTDANVKERIKHIEYKDIAVLVNTHKQAQKVSKTLSKNGIPNYVHSSGGDEEYAEDREFLFGYLRLLSNFHDDVTLAVTLLSPLTTFAEGDLVKIRGGERDKPFWVSFVEYSGDQTLVDKRDAFLNAIRKHRAVAATTNVRVLLDTVIKDFSYDAYIMGADFGEERISSLNIFLESLAHIGTASDLARFNQYVESGAKWNVTTPSGGGDAVSVMTIHASKGLEFPIVFLPYADYDSGRTGLKNADKDFLIADRKYGVAIDYYDDVKKTKHRTLTGAFLETVKKHKDLEERLRVMYVALTRAKNHLFVTMKNQEVKKFFPEENPTFAKWLLMAKEYNPSLDKFFVDRIEAMPIAQVKPQAPEVTQENVDVDFDLLKYVYPYAKETATEVKYTVTSLLHDGEKSAPIDTEEAEHICTLGTAYHAVLEKIDFHQCEKGDVTGVVEGLTLEGVIKEDISKEIDPQLISNILKLPVFDIAREGKAIKEKAFMLYLPAADVVEGETSKDKVLVQGVIDLLILGKQNVLVDYKYSALSPEKLAQKYRKQVSVYRQAVEKLMKIKIDKTIIIALKSGKEIQID